MNDQFFFNKTILVTGATGLIGEHVCRALVKKGAKVIALSRNEKKLRTCFSDLLDSSGFCYIAQDVSSPLLIEETIDIIFHAAGPIASDIIRNRPMEIVAPNIFGTNNLLLFLKNQRETRGVTGRMVLCSSATVYSNPTDKDIFVREEDTYYTDGLQADHAPYAQSKRMMEVLANSFFQQFGVEIFIARLSYVYGPATFRADTAFYEFIEKASRGEEIRINNPCMERRDWIYVDDAVEGLLLLPTLSGNERIFNISSGGEGNSFLAADEIAVIAADIYNKKHPGAARHSRTVYAGNGTGQRKLGIILDNSCIKNYGMRIKTDMYAGIEKTMAGMGRDRAAVLCH